MKFYLIILSVLLLAACGGKEEPEEQIRPVFYQKVEKQSVSEIRSFAGISQPNNEAKLSFRVGGNI
ncbi:MAG: efflux RND transporter periplasmic adaptor subunit, partial [Phycisphaerae bacterium]